MVEQYKKKEYTSVYMGCTVHLFKIQRANVFIYSSSKLLRLILLYIFILIILRLNTYIYIYFKNYYETWTAVTVCIYLLLSLGLINLIKTTPKHPGDMSVYQLDRPNLLITVYYIFIIIVANPETHGNHW